MLPATNFYTGHRDEYAGMLNFFGNHLAVLLRKCSLLN